MLENQRFPPTVNALANPRDMLWMSAPAVTHGYSGGPVFGLLVLAVFVPFLMVPAVIGSAITLMTRMQSASDSLGLMNCAIGVAIRNQERALARSRLGNQWVK